MQEQEIKALAIDALNDLKGKDIVCLDVSKQTEVTDFMIIVSGTSSRHVKALAGNVLTEATKAGIKAIGTEGMDDGEWVLIDLVDVVVHVMLPQAREFYDLERLWSMESATNGETPSIEH